MLVLAAPFALLSLAVRGVREIVTRVLVVLVALWAIGGDAVARGFVVDDVRGEADVADEAGAITLLVRSALVASRHELVAPPVGLTVSGAAAALAAVGADRAVLLDLERDGTTLRVTVVIVGAGDPRVARISAGDGDLRSLAQRVLDQITSDLKLERATVRDVSLGRLRPLTTAIRVRRADSAAAAAALAQVDPLTLIAVTAATEVLRGVPATVVDRSLSALAARALGDVAHLDGLATGSDPAALAARAFAAMQRFDLDGIDELLRKGSPRNGAVAIARLKLAEARGDDKALAARIRDGLASDQVPGVLAVVSLVAPGRLAEPIQRVVLTAAAKTRAVLPGVVSRIGLAAAVAQIDTLRALDLVSVRELDDSELAQLVPLIESASHPAALRLRAELAIRRADGSDKAAIAALLKATPSEPRALRYHGWSLMREGRPVEAAAAFAKAGLRGEQARALLAGRDPKSALTAVEGQPTSAIELVIAARVALDDNRIEDAAKLITLAETAAPVSPAVHAVVIELARHRAAPAAVAVAKLIALDPGPAIPEVAPTPVPDKAASKELGSGAGSELPIGSAASGGGAIDVALDATPLIEILDELPALQELGDRRLALAALPSEAPWHSLRRADAAVVRAGLVKLLSAPPYGLQISTAADVERVDLATLAPLAETVPSVLLYRVVPDGAGVEVTLTLYHRGATAVKQYGKTISMPGVVTWDLDKLIPLGGGLVVLLLGGVLWWTRSTSTVRIEIERSPDVADEVLCIAITKSRHRPVVHDLAKFHASTMKEGAKTGARAATLISGGATFKVPKGRWFVHLYGTYTRGHELRRVPDTCTKEIEATRGGSLEVEFNLTSKLAEVTVVMESEPRRGVVVWPNNDVDAKLYTGDSGEVKLDLPLGSHTIHIEVGGQRFEQNIQIVSPKMQRVGFNVAREQRVARSLSIDSDEVVAAELEIAGAPAVSMPQVPQAPRAALATARTQLPTPEGPQVSFKSKPRAMTPVPGQLLLGRYKIVAELGRGAMGVVHRAFDEKLEREVAIKEMAEDLHRNPEAMRLFMQEAKALAQLNHTNIVAMYDQLTDSDKVYMIMEFVDGKPLAEILETNGTFRWRDAVALVDQVCAGLAYAHARKVIHRDIKPANIFVTKDRTAKIGDFGLARVMREVTIQRTEIRGTPLYMAPEQITGTDVDHRTDLYALGCMFFELVCSRPPFIDGDILYAQMHAPPPSPRDLCPDLPEPLSALILSLLAKSSDDRPGSANEVRAALKSL